MKKWTNIRDMSRIIRDVRNANRDYYIPTWRAKQLFDEQKLIQVQVYNNQWDYCSPAGSMVR